MQFVEQISLPQFQFAFQHRDKLLGILAQHFADGQFHRTIVLDDDDAARDGRLAIRESVKRVHHFFRVHAGWTFDFDLDVLGCEIVDGFHLELALLRRVLNRGHERIRRGRRRNFRDDDRGFVARLDSGADFHRTFAVLIIARVHQAAGGKIRQALERLSFQNRNLRFQQFGKIMRQNPRTQTDRDAFGAEHQRNWQFARQRHRLLVAPVVARNKIGDRIIENFRAREFRQPALDVARRGGGIAGENISKISLSLDQISFIRQHHQRVADGCVAVRMILHRVADDVGDLDETSVILLVQRPKDAPLHGLQAIREIWNRAVADDVAGVIQKAAIHARVQAGGELFRVERLVDDVFHRLGNDVVRAVAVSIGFIRGFGLDWCGRWRAFDGQFWLAQIFFSFG